MASTSSSICTREALALPGAPARLPLLLYSAPKSPDLVGALCGLLLGHSALAAWSLPTQGTQQAGLIWRAAHKQEACGLGGCEACQARPNTVRSRQRRPRPPCGRECQPARRAPSQPEAAKGQPGAWQQLRTFGPLPRASAHGPCPLPWGAVQMACMPGLPVSTAQRRGTEGMGVPRCSPLQPRLPASSSACQLPMCRLHTPSL